MPETFQSLQNKVANRLVNASPAVINEVPSLINYAIRDVEDKMNFSCMRAETKFNTTLNTRVLGRIPADFKEKRDRPYWLDQVGTPFFLEWFPSFDEATKLYSPQELKTNPVVSPLTDIGQPTFLTPIYDEGVNPIIMADGSTGITPFDVAVWPLPDANGFDLLPDNVTKIYTIYVPYWRYLPDLVNPNDQNWFTFYGPQYILDQATGRGFMLDWDEQRAQGWFTLATQWKNQLLRKAANELKSPGKFMRMRADVYGDADQWRRS